MNECINIKYLIIFAHIYFGRMLVLFLLLAAINDTGFVHVERWFSLIGEIDK